MNRTVRLILPLLTCVAAACDDGASMPMSPAPAMPALMPGMAAVDGRVVGPDGHPIADAKVNVADTAFGATMTSTTTDADGRFHLAVLANTTITLKADATGYARSLVSSFALAPGATTSDVELHLVPTAIVEQLNGMGGPRVADYGAIALEVKSLGGACDPTGGTVRIDPAPLGKVFYGKPGQIMPDGALTSVQTGATPAAWVLGALPPGTYYRFIFEKAGCTQKSGTVDWMGRSYDGHLAIEAKAVSAGMLFVE